MITKQEYMDLKKRRAELALELVLIKRLIYGNNVLPIT